MRLDQFDTASVEHTLLPWCWSMVTRDQQYRRDTFIFWRNDWPSHSPFLIPLLVPAVGFTDLVRDRASDVTSASLFIQGDEIKTILSNYCYCRPCVYDSYRYRCGRCDRSCVMVLPIGNNGIIRFVKDTKTSPRLGAYYKTYDDLSFYVSLVKVLILPRSERPVFISLFVSSQALASRGAFANNGTCI